MTLVPGYKNQVDSGGLVACQLTSGQKMISRDAAGYGTPADCENFMLKGEARV